LDNIAYLLLQAFECGIDYGLLLAEEERDSEDMFDAFLCGEAGRKFNVPSIPARRRQPHSMEWRNAKRESFKNFADLLAQSIASQSN
jgi:hypothetical protein